MIQKFPYDKEAAEKAQIDAEENCLAIVGNTVRTTFSLFVDQTYANLLP